MVTKLLVGYDRGLSNIINLRIFTTEYTEFHGGKDGFRTKTPWYSVTSVVIFFLSL